MTPRGRTTGRALSLLGGLLASLCLLPASARGWEGPLGPGSAPWVRQRDAVALVGVGVSGGPLQAAAVVGAGSSVDSWSIDPLPIEGRPRTALGAATLLSAVLGSPTPPLTQVHYVVAGEFFNCWTIRGRYAQVSPLNPEFLRGVRDEERLPDGPVAETERGLLETAAYNEAVIKAHFTPAAVFESQAQPAVAYRHLMQQPAAHRGQVVLIEGRLARIRRMAPTLEAAVAGIDHLYEVFLFVQGNREKPVCLVTTQLPEGLKVAERIPGDPLVVFAGYFLKTYIYKSGERLREREYRVAPLLIGHLILKERPRSEAPVQNWTAGLLPLFFGILLGTLGVVFLVTVVFRRSDARTLARLQASATAFATPEPHGYPASAREEKSEASPEKPVVEPFWQKTLQEGSSGSAEGSPD